MHSPFSPGDAVRARGRVWRLRDVTEHADCVSLNLEPPDHRAPSKSVVLLHPFDRVTHAPAPERPQPVSLGAFWRALAGRAVTLRAHDTLISPATAALDLLPYQLEPAIAMTLNGVTRVLLADAVGLGKTIQAGLAIAEAFARGDASRALVLVPAALRDQWSSELRDRFSLGAEVIDVAALRTIGAQLPRTVNPWTVPRVAIVSLDFAKRPEVRAEMADVRWDMVVIDEAHSATQDSDRYRAADLFASRARRVLLLTATPHSGDDRAFASLARLGAATPAEPLVLFRRSRADTGIGSTRRSRLLRVRLGSAELATLRLLLAYLRTIWAALASPHHSQARLVAILLLKRALSSPASLARSIHRRRALLTARDEPTADQLLLPLGDDTDPSDDEPSALLGTPGLATLADEVAWLDQIAAALDRAARESRKFRAIERLVRRAREPLIVFTEYRDTLAELEHALQRAARCVSLHGGLDRAERQAVLDAFAGGQADVLLATDAAGVGLNLHHRCRTVVNLELPWNPVRLEQRVGRVDRLGQHRTVHAIHLVGRATPEERVLARLAGRSARARSALSDTAACFTAGSAMDEAVTAETLMGLRGSRQFWSALPATSSGDDEAHTILRRVVLAEEARQEAAAQQRLRHLHSALRRAGAPRNHSARRVPGVMVAVAGRRHGRKMGGGYSGGATSILAVFELRIVDGSGRLVDECLLPFSLTDVGLSPPAGSRRVFARRLVAALAARLSTYVDDVAGNRVRQVRAHLAEVQSLTRPRDQALLQQLQEQRLATAAYQPGLFDRRAERDAERASFDRAAQDAALRLHDGAGLGDGAVVALPARLGWVLVRLVP